MSTPEQEFGSIPDQPFVSPQAATSRKPNILARLFGAEDQPPNFGPGPSEEPKGSAAATKLRESIDRMRPVQEARAEWKTRRQAACDAVELPVTPYRVRRMTEADQWFCEKAIAEAHDYPVSYSEEKHGKRDFGSGLSLAYSLSGLTYPAAAYADDQPEAWLSWQTIGPQRVRQTDPYSYGYGDRYSRHPGYEIAPFSTYDEAAKWLAAYLKPVADEVYFDAEGKAAEAEV